MNWKILRKVRYSYSFLIAMVIHAVIFSYYSLRLNEHGLLGLNPTKKVSLNDPIALKDIKTISQSEVEKIRQVGIKDGKKNLNQPDLAFDQRAAGPAQIPQPPVEAKAEQKKSASNQSGAPLSLDQLSTQNLELPKDAPVKKETAPQTSSENYQGIARDNIAATPSDDGGHFYFNPKSQKVITRSSEQEIIKREANRGTNLPVSRTVDKISNFEIRYERPEGVSADELNSDEKAYYSFYVRSYKNYFAKIYSTYEKIVLVRPRLAKSFDKKHLLIGKIDYDENGDIVTVKIIKSSDDDDLHYFFEETLKQLSQPNPPKVFTKNQKQFSIFYQIQIN